MNKKIPPLLFLFLLFPLVTGCAKVWRPVFIPGKKIAPEYYAKPPYYNGTHQLCAYEGPHIHDPKLGPISVVEPDAETVRTKYRYPGMEDQFKDLDQRVW